MSSANAMNVTIENTDVVSITVDYREGGKHYDSHVEGEDAMQANFDSVTIAPGQSHSFVNADILRMRKHAA